MKALGSVLVLAGLLVGCAGVGVAPDPLQGAPIASVSELVGARVIGTCPPEDMVARAEIRTESEFYAMLISSEARKFILLDMADGEETPVWLGHVTADGQIVVERKILYRELTEQIAHPCEWLAPPKA